MMKKLTYVMLTCMIFGVQAQAGSVLFTFDNVSPHTPLPIDVTVAGLTAHLSATGDGFSIQQLGIGTNGIMPVGFSGNCIFPSSINSSDLLVGFSQSLTDFSILFATGEIATDSAATMRVTAYMNGALVGTNTATANPPFTWPSGTLSFSSAQSFNSVVVHYDSPPPTGGDFTPIFMADNMIVTTAGPSVVPEPSSLTLLGVGALGLLACPWLRRWG
jgi:hypothetical protein